MNTPAHLILGSALFARPPKTTTLLTAFVGSGFPDLSVVVMVRWARNIEGHSPGYIFNVLYFSETWQTVFAIDNSILLWSALLALGIWRGWALFVVFTGCALIHVVTDLFLHHDDGRAHFWPLSMWKFESPVSYWDSAHHANTVAPLLLLVSLISVIVLFRRFRSWPPRTLFAALLAADIYFSSVWFRFF
ncbi:MAG: cobalamin biosynthesis protein CobQ [Pseudomonadota bacterium]